MALSRTKVASSAANSAGSVAVITNHTSVGSSGRNVALAVVGDRPEARHGKYCCSYGHKWDGFLLVRYSARPDPVEVGGSKSSTCQQANR